MSKTEIILLSHGSRLEKANEDILKLSRLLQDSKQDNDMHVTAAFLQFASPSLTEAIHDAVQRGSTQVLVTPLFLTTGVHITEDIPQIIQSVSSLYQEVSIKQCNPLGSDEKLLPIIWERIQEQMG